MSTGTPVRVGPTGVPPRGWQWRLLTDIARLESGHTPSRREPSYWEGGDICWLSLRDLRGLTGKRIFDTFDKPTQAGIDNSSARLLPQDTVALCRTASVGKVTILGREMATSQDFVNWVCGPELLPDFLYWALVASEPMFDSEKQGSTHKTIYMPVLMRFSVLVPPLQEQRRIAEVLDHVASLQSLRYEGLAASRELLRSAFVHLFGDPSLNPREWPVVALGKLLTETQYGTADPANTEQLGIPVLRMNNITSEGALDLRDLKWCEIAPEDADAYTLRPGDLLFNRTNSPELVGKTAVWHYPEPYAFAGYLIRVRLDEERLLPDYVSGLLNSEWGKQYLRTRAKPSNNMSNFSASQLREIPIPVPPLELQRKYKEVVEGERETRSFLTRSSADLALLRSTLLHRAFTGTL